MAEFGVSPSKLKGQIGDFVPIQAAIKSDIQAINSIATRLAFSDGSTERVRRSLRVVSGRLDDSEKKLKAMKRALGDISTAYIRTEQNVKDHAVIPGFEVSGSLFNAEASASAGVQDGKASASAGASASVAEGTFAYDSRYGSVTGEGKVLSAEANAEAEAHAYRTEDGFEAGASASASAGASAAEGSVSAESKYAAGSIAGSLLAAEASAAAAATLGYHDGYLYGELSAKAEVSASVAHGEAEGRLGAENLNMYGKAEGSAVGAGASAEAGVTVNENGSVSVKAKAEAEAYLAKGEVSGGFNILGIEIGVGIEGMVGVQAEAGGEISTSGFELDLGLGPIGGNLSIDWSGFELPGFSDIADTIFWWY